jgi:hypothetical protein
MIAGILLISTGLLMVTGLMTRLSIWMLDAMPWLGTLG